MSAMGESKVRYATLINLIPKRHQGKQLCLDKRYWPKTLLLNLAISTIGLPPTLLRSARRPIYKEDFP